MINNNSQIGGGKKHSISKYAIKPPLEAYTRSLIEKRLEALKYNLDEMKSDCNVYRERAKYQYQDDLLKGKNPDFLIYQSGTSRILAVIEAKRPSKTLEQAITQAIELYAEPLNIPIIFVFNSGTFYSCTKERKPIKIDNVEINDFVDESTLLQLINNKFEIETIPSGLSLTKAELIQKFRVANKLLRKSGLRNGYERFSVFSDLLFLKLKDDLSDIGEDLSQNKDLNRICNWKKLIDKMPKKENGNFIIPKIRKQSQWQSQLQ